MAMAISLIRTVVLSPSPGSPTSLVFSCVTSGVPESKPKRSIVSFAPCILAMAFDREASNAGLLHCNRFFTLLTGNLKRRKKNSWFGVWNITHHFVSFQNSFGRNFNYIAMHYYYSCSPNTNKTAWSSQSAGEWQHYKLIKKLTWADGYNIVLIWLICGVVYVHIYIIATPFYWIEFLELRWLINQKTAISVVLKKKHVPDSRLPLLRIPEEHD